MATANERLHDGLIDRQVDQQLFANGMDRRVARLLQQADPDLFAQLEVAIRRNPNSFTTQRLDALLVTVRELNASIYARLLADMDADLRGFTESELGFHGNLVDDVLPIRVPLVAVAPEQAYAAVVARPFQGKLLSEWADTIGEARMARIRSAVRLGFTEGQTVAQMVQRIRGTRALGYRDGIIEIDRRHAEAVVRTAVAHTAQVSRELFYDANDDLVKAVQWVATLDSRTTEDCRVRDGKTYTPDKHKPIGHAIPWLGGPGRLHWCCRSTSVPVLKSWRELGFDVDEVTPGARASMDGEVPVATTYGDWFGRQSAARQDEIVGRQRGELFRSGAVTFDRFSNDKGQWLSLEQLRQRGVRR